MTGLRGVAAAYVALYHFSHHIPSPTIHRALHKGYLAVDVFFVLSGFVMAMTYRTLFSDKLSARSFGRFMWLRFARIWPVAAVSLVIMIGLLYRAGAPAPISSILPNLLLIQAWGLGSSINQPLWSVSAEIVASLLFPVLISVVAGSETSIVVAITLLCAAMICGVAYAGAHNGVSRVGLLDLYEPFSALPVLRCLAGFILGMIVWRASLISTVAAVSSHSAAALSCVASMVALLAADANDLLMYSLIPFLVLSIAHDRGVVAQLLAARPTRALGALSYPIYALQASYYVVAEPRAARIAASMASPASTIAYYGLIGAGLLLSATVVHLAVELPARDTLRRLQWFSAKPGERRLTQAELCPVNRTDPGPNG